MTPDYDDLITRAQAFAAAGEAQERERAAAYPRCAWCGEPTPGNAGNGRTPICAECYRAVAVTEQAVRRLHRGE